MEIGGNAICFMYKFWSAFASTEMEDHSSSEIFWHISGFRYNPEIVPVHKLFVSPHENITLLKHLMCQKMMVCSCDIWQ